MHEVMIQHNRFSKDFAMHMIYFKEQLLLLETILISMSRHTYTILLKKIDVATICPWLMRLSLSYQAMVVSLKPCGNSLTPSRGKWPHANFWIMSCILTLALHLHVSWWGTWLGVGCPATKQYWGAPDRWSFILTCCSSEKMNILQS